MACYEESFGGTKGCDVIHQSMFHARYLCFVVLDGPCYYMQDGIWSKNRERRVGSPFVAQIKPGTKNVNTHWFI